MQRNACVCFAMRSHWGHTRPAQTRSLYVVPLPVQVEAAVSSEPLLRGADPKLSKPAAVHVLNGTLFSYLFGYLPALRPSVIKSLR